jgi:hypothetical protein
MHAPSITLPPGVKAVSGKKLARKLQRIEPAHRALLVHDLEAGAVWLHDLTRHQSCSLVPVSLGYVGTVANASPEDVRRLRAGTLSLSELHNRPLSDAAIDKLIAKIGLSRIWQAMDRATRPAAPANGRTEVDGNQLEMFA